LNAGALLPLAAPDWLKIGHMTRTIIILGLADLCHIT